MKIFISILANAIGLLLAVWLLPQFLGPESITWDGNLVELLIAGFVIGLVNGVLRPFVKLLSLPLMILTLGFFGIIINVAMIWLVDYALAGLTINGFFAYLLTSIVLAVVHVIL